MAAKKDERKPLKRANGTGCIINLGARRRKTWTIRITKGIDEETGKQNYQYLGYFETKGEAKKLLDSLDISSISPLLK